MRIPSGSSIRIGIITQVGRTYIEFSFLDSLNGQVYRTPKPHPYAGRGGGFLAGIEKDTLILVANGPGENGIAFLLYQIIIFILTLMVLLI